jgi:hypothetical protein
MAVLLLALLVAGCSGSKPPTDNATAGADLRVINRHYLSMEVYVLADAQRVRLGRLRTNETKTFRIPGYLLAGATPLQFSMESGGPSRIILSEEIMVVPGEEVTLVIPNTR